MKNNALLTNAGVLALGLAVCVALAAYSVPLLLGSMAAAGVLAMALNTPRPRSARSA